MKVWTLKDQNNWKNSYKNFPIGTIVKLSKNYTGDEDRHGLTAKILEVIVREIDPGHIAFDQFGFTHEELYRVQYSDGKESVVWPEEILISESRGL